VVLAGGASRRLGRDKATLDAGGETLAARAARKLSAVCAEVAVADRGRGLLPGLPFLSDGPGAGPAAGILGAAETHPGRPLLVLACDLPAVPVALLAELAREGAADWCVPRWEEGIEPLCALYRPRALTALADAVAAGEMAPHRLAVHPALAVRYLEGEVLAHFGEPRAMFLNLNDPGDLARWDRSRAGR
jgi:molybdopterin-guanine dinucleotide biosynthesis protein A